ncbi:MAG: hypothetical protein SGARI_004107 [Bacillariaceae sp.]
MKLEIRRDAVLQESMHLLMLVPASDIRQRLRIEFIEEPGLDAGGLLREWVLLLGEQMFDDSFDQELYRNMLWVRENSGVESLSLDFTIQQRDAEGKITTVELKPGGSELIVDDGNKEEYLKLMLKYRMFDSVSEQLSYVLKGLYDVFPKTLLAVFDYQELELLLCGVPEIDVEDWKGHTDVKYLDYDNPLKSELNVIGWFWETILSFPQEHRARLLQFVTGTSRVPVEGFKALMSNDGRVRRFGIQIVGRGIPPTGLYPKAHTCFNRIDIPLYTSKEELEKYLTLVINMEITGFSMQ